MAACVGPVTAGPFQQEGIPVIQPARSRLGALARAIVEQVPGLCGRWLPVAGHTVEIRGQAAVDGRLVPLSSASMALLRELSDKPGHVVSRSALLKITPGDSSDEHAVEVAVGRAPDCPR